MIGGRGQRARQAGIKTPYLMIFAVSLRTRQADIETPDLMIYIRVNAREMPWHRNTALDDFPSRSARARPDEEVTQEADKTLQEATKESNKTRQEPNKENRVVAWLDPSAFNADKLRTRCGHNATTDNSVTSRVT